MYSGRIASDLTLNSVHVAGYAASDLIDWTEDPAIAAMVTSWPARFETRRAHALGLRAEQSFDDIVREYLSGLQQPWWDGRHRDSRAHRAQGAPMITKPCACLISRPAEAPQITSPGARALTAPIRR